MTLTDGEKAMLDGAAGPGKQKAMELLVRYAEALGAERFVDTNNIAGVPGSFTLFLKDYYKEHAATAAITRRSSRCSISTATMSCRCPRSPRIAAICRAASTRN